MYLGVKSEEEAGVFQGNKCIPGEGSSRALRWPSIWKTRKVQERQSLQGGSRLGYFTSEESEAQRDESTQLRSYNFSFADSSKGI